PAQGVEPRHGAGSLPDRRPGPGDPGSSARSAARSPARSPRGASAGAELLDLLGGQAARGARLQRSEAQRAEGDAAQLDHGVADRLEHAADLALAALGDHQLDLLAVDAAGPRGGGAAVVELDTLAQADEVLLGGTAADLRAVGLGHAEARVGEAMGELAVV